MPSIWFSICEDCSRQVQQNGYSINKCHWLVNNPFTRQMPRLMYFIWGCLQCVSAGQVCWHLHINESLSSTLGLQPGIIQGLRQWQPGTLARRTCPSLCNLQCKSINSVGPAQQHCRTADCEQLVLKWSIFSWVAIPLCQAPRPSLAIALIRRGSPEQAAWWRTGTPMYQFSSSQSEKIRQMFRNTWLRFWLD